MKRFGLLPKILIAIALGIICGIWLPTGAVRIFSTFNSIFGEFLSFIIPLIILGLVAPAIADIGKDAGRLLIQTVILAYGFTLLAGILSYGVSVTSFPSFIDTRVDFEVQSKAVTPEPFFTISITVLDKPTKFFLQDAACNNPLENIYFNSNLSKAGTLFNENILSEMSKISDDISLFNKLTLILRASTISTKKLAAT